MAADCRFENPLFHYRQLLVKRHGGIGHIGVLGVFRQLQVRRQIVAVDAVVFRRKNSIFTAGGEIRITFLPYFTLMRLRKG